jgi:hypothetical protein
MYSLQYDSTCISTGENTPLVSIMFPFALFHLALCDARYQQLEGCMFVKPDYVVGLSPGVVIRRGIL